jgi:hypothetical protein
MPPPADFPHLIKPPDPMEETLRRRLEERTPRAGGASSQRGQFIAELIAIGEPIRSAASSSPR